MLRLFYRVAFFCRVTVYPFTYYPNESFYQVHGESPPPYAPVVKHDTAAEDSANLSRQNARSAIAEHDTRHEFNVE